MGLKLMTCGLKFICTSGLQWLAIGGLLRIYSRTNFRQKRTRMSFRGRSFEELHSLIKHKIYEQTAMEEKKFEDSTLPPA